ncbi:MAG: chemotaxis protein CheV [Gammaproteobacteria bacterium]|nr:chemotaxis protein CheV [Gammaproteobacteria bacterium]
MSSILDGVNQRTKLVGHNRLELLLFRLGGKQRYGINVFKVQEVIRCPDLTHLPNSSAVIRGVATIRKKTIPVIDLAMAIGGTEQTQMEGSFVIVTEFNRSLLGMLVHSVDRIINKNWEEIMPPPKGAGMECYVISVTQVEEELVEVLDVEKVRAEVIGTPTDPSEETLEMGRKAEEQAQEDEKERLVFVIDDSRVARKQVQRTLDTVGIKCVSACDGREALEMLQGWAKNDDPMLQKINMIISDIEMPEMDGYTLTMEVKKDPRLQHLYILLHSSLSGVFNETMVKKVGADKFIPKFHPDHLTQTVLECLDGLNAQGERAA